MAEKTKSAPLLSTNQIETTVERETISVGETPFGELFAEVALSPKGKKTIINRSVYQDNNGNRICIPINFPPDKIDTEALYPYRELRMTQTRFNEMDFVPVDGWVKEPFKDGNGQIIRDSNGHAINMFFLCKLRIESVAENQECKYGSIQYMLGNDIILDSEAKKRVGGSFGVFARQRVGEDDEVVSV